MKVSQGTLANLHGSKNRESVAALLMAHDFVEIGPVRVDVWAENPLVKFEEVRASSFEQPLSCFAVDVPVCVSLYGKPYKANFLVKHRDWPEPLALMSYTQKSGGTTLWKYEYLYANLAYCVPCRSIVIVDGPAFHSAFFRRADEWVLNTKGRIARTFSGLTDFRMWLTEGAVYPHEVQTMFSWIQQGNDA